MALWKNLSKRQAAMIIRAIRNSPAIDVPSTHVGTARSLCIKDIFKQNDDGRYSLSRDAMWDLERDRPARYGNSSIMAAWRERRTWFLREIRIGEENLKAGRLDDDDPDMPKQLSLFKDLNA